MPNVQLQLCVNGDQGVATGYIERVELVEGNETLLDLNSCIWPPSSCPRFSYLGGAIKVSRRKFEITGRKEWVGNWCWDAVGMRPDEAVRLLEYLRELGWQCEGGVVEAADAWEKGNVADIFRAEQEQQHAS